MTYQIQDERSGQILATVNDETVSQWWAANEADYFGVRVIGQTIVVAKVGAQ